MGAQMVIVPQDSVDQGFGLLKDIVEMVKNPKAIEEAYQAQRKAAELTVGEIKEAEEARTLIAQAKDLRAELESARDLLDADRERHVQEMANAVAANKKTEDSLGRLSSELEAISVSQVEMASMLKADRKKMEDQIRDSEIALSNRSAELDAREMAIKDGEDANTQEAERLAKLAEKLKAKASRLAKEAEIDE